MTALFLSFFNRGTAFLYAHPEATEDELDEITLSFPDMSEAPFMVNMNLYIGCDRGSICIKKRNLRLGVVSKQLFSCSKYFFVLSLLPISLDPPAVAGLSLIPCKKIFRKKENGCR